MPTSSSQWFARANVEVAGLGDYQACGEVASGCLVEVLADVMEGDEEPISAVYPGGARLPRSVRVFLDSLFRACRRSLIGRNPCCQFLRPVHGAAVI